MFYQSASKFILTTCMVYRFFTLFELSIYIGGHGSFLNIYKVLKHWH